MKKSIVADYDRIAGYSLPVYIFICKNIQRARYWYNKTCEKFDHNWRQWKNNVGRIQFADCAYYFVSQYGAREYLRGMHRYNPIVYTEECIYIILDDIERFRIDERDSSIDTTYYNLWVTEMIERGWEV